MKRINKVEVKERKGKEAKKKKIKEKEGRGTEEKGKKELKLWESGEKEGD